MLAAPAAFGGRAQHTEPDPGMSGVCSFLALRTVDRADLGPIWGRSGADLGPIWAEEGTRSVLNVQHAGSITVPELALSFHLPPIS